MAAVIGTAGAIVGLLNAAITLVQQIRQARDRVNGSSRALQDVRTQLEMISTSLELVRDEPRLHTPAVEAQVSAITSIMEELKTFFDVLQAEQEKSKMRQFGHALRSGDKDDKKLSGILARLSGARQELIVRISVVHVGLTGNLIDGFQVAQRVVMEMNENVMRALGTPLCLAELLQARQLDNAEVVTLREEDIEVLGLREDDQNERERYAGAIGDSKNLNWHRNKTGDDAKIMAGNLGLDESEKATVVKASVDNSEFGRGLGVMVGTVGKEGAKSFNENFWKTR
ncbi:hypothetical protein QBC37DRAFT_421245 [Rhypophila decipiens]|uniref:Fungal N-terminal domain-containing protein n=1 Tax=Rhypophila decipiens TaxID=261697 RepID=A0AAN6Y9B6_9PEZI|nr:hypothetical protein QBC37DRAFT_421245 [Rhypophila decipiens]